MKPDVQVLSTLLALLLVVTSKAENPNPNPKCSAQDQGSTLQVFHVYSQCSPFRPPKALSWADSVLQMQAQDQARLQYLASLVAGKSVVPIASGRQITQSPTYIVRAKIGTPPQTLLLAVDTSNDAAWIPCTGCLGCSSAAFDPVKSTSFKSLPCQAAQCKQVCVCLCFFTLYVTHAPTRHLLARWLCHHIGLSKGGFILQFVLSIMIDY